MCGVPYHAAETIFPKLLRKGFKVAICDRWKSQRGQPSWCAARSRGCSTPGTAIDSSVGSEEKQFPGGVGTSFGRGRLAALDLSTGEFRATEFRGPDAERPHCGRASAKLRPREVPLPFLPAII